MRHLLIILIVLCSLQLFAQNDTSFPLSVFIKIDKEYEVKYPKDYFNYQMSRGMYNIKTDSVKQKQYDIEVTLKNNSQQPIYIWLMSCSWEDNFKINNNYINFYTLGCDKNVPELVKINEGENKIYKITLAKSIKFENPCENCIYGPQVETTKLGLIIIDDIFKPKLNPFLDYNLAMEDESLWKIIWSNSLYLLSKDEAHPKPKQIPVYQNGQN